MPALSMLGLYKCAQITMPLLKAGGKMLRSAMTAGGEAGEWEKGVQDILNDQVKELMKGKIETLTPKKLKAVEAPLVSFTGLVLQSLVQDVLETDEFASVKTKFNIALKQLPLHWETFVSQGLPNAQPLTDTEFLRALQSAHEGTDTFPAVPQEWLAAFFSQWLERHVGLTIQRAGWNQKLAVTVAPLIADGVSSTLVADHPVATAAFRECMLRFHTEHLKMLNQIEKRTSEIAKTQKKEIGKATKRHKEVKNDLGEVKAMLRKQTAADRIKKYKEALLTGFRPYQELGIDDYERGEKETSDIRDIFVHPACSKEHLRPEDMDAAQRETPPRLPTQDLLPLLARDDHRRTVLLADPGMGKSTLIQSIIAHLASERSFTGATALTGLLPVPLILRDLVPLLPPDQVENWSWDDLLTVLIEHYKRDETAPLLCDSFKDHGEELRQIIHTDKAVIFLIDGLDEIGDLSKRRQIVKCIQDGIRAANKEARWLITSRVIGYEDAPVDKLSVPRVYNGESDKPRAAVLTSQIKHLYELMLEQQDSWHEYILHKSADEIFELSPEYRETERSQRWQTFQSKFPDTKTEDLEHLAAVISVKSIAKLIHLAPFDDKRQDTFTQRWFQHRHSTNYSHELMREVRSHHHDGVRIISRVPNLLCMMNILKRSGKPLPDGRAALYDAIVQAYLGGIDAAYRLRPVLGNTCPFDTAQRRFLLSLLGAHMQQIRSAYMQTTPEIEEIAETETDAEMEGASFGADGNILISRPELEQLLLPAIQRMREEGRLVSTHTTAELLDELLHHIASRSGLLIPRSCNAEGNTLYGFTHLSFLEFFAADWLGMEFDRLRNRNSRRKEAEDDKQCITEADLDREFPPHGPIQHTRESFRDLPAIPAWHEPLIFLLESRKADTPTLLRWLFSALHSHQPHVVSKEDQNPTPLMPLDAVQLAVNLTQNPEIHLTTEARQQWWHRLWFAYLTWPYHPAAGDKSTQWPIAPMLINNNEFRTEVIKALIEVYSSTELTTLPELAPDGTKGSQAATRRLILFDCVQLTSSDLVQLTALSHLKCLLLNNCVGLETLPDLSNLKNLSILYLVNCSGLHGDNAFDTLSSLNQLSLLIIANCPGLTRLPDLQANKALEILELRDNTELHGPDGLRGLAGLTKLFHLNLSRCTKLEQLPDLRALKCLKSLKLNGCTSLKGVHALGDLSALSALENLELIGCTGLTKDDVAELQRNLSEKCKISANT
jgi:hypothetical protein